MPLANLGNTSDEAEPPPQQEAACAGVMNPAEKARAALETSAALVAVLNVFLSNFKTIPYIDDAFGVTVKVA